MTETIVSAAVLVRWEDAPVPMQCIVSMSRPGIGTGTCCTASEGAWRARRAFSRPPDGS